MEKKMTKRVRQIGLAAAALKAGVAGGAEAWLWSQATKERGRSAACYGCLDGTSDGQGHFQCRQTTPAADALYEAGYLQPVLEQSGWVWH